MDEKVLEARMSTAQTAVTQIGIDAENGCIPCVEYHWKLLNDTIYDIMEEMKAEQQ